MESGSTGYRKLNKGRSGPDKRFSSTCMPTSPAPFEADQQKHFESQRRKIEVVSSLLHVEKRSASQLGQDHFQRQDFSKNSAKKLDGHFTTPLRYGRRAAGSGLSMYKSTAADTSAHKQRTKRSGQASIEDPPELANRFSSTWSKPLGSQIYNSQAERKSRRSLDLSSKRPITRESVYDLMRKRHAEKRQEAPKKEPELGVTEGVMTAMLVAKVGHANRTERPCRHQVVQSMARRSLDHEKSVLVQAASLLER